MHIKKDASGHSATIATIFVSFLLFYFFLLLQNLVVDYSAGSSFIPVYLPAGVLLISILVGGVAGAFGVFLALVSNYIFHNPNVYWPIIVGLIAFSLIIQVTVIKIFAHFAGVGPNLEGLNYLKVTGLAFVFSLSHSFNHHLNLVVIQDRKVSWAESKIAISTFLGVTSVLFILLIVSKIRNYLLKRNRLMSL